MKRTVRNVLVSAATLAVVTGGPVAAASIAAAAPAVPHAVVAQQQNDDDQDGRDQDDDNGLWGLLGLVGLVGLVGLIRRGRSNDRLAGPAAAPPATPSERLDREPVDQTYARAPQQYFDPAQPPRDSGYRQQ